MRPPCPTRCSSDVRAVYGYGDPNADFHLIGDHPGVHGGRETAVPFTGLAPSERLLSVLETVGLVDLGEPERPRPTNLFMSYLHMCCPSEGADPTPAEYANLERFFDAEMRAIAAHVLLPVGDRAFVHVRDEFTAKAAKLDRPPGDYHATEIAGRGFIVVPIRDPATWDDPAEAALRDTFERLLDSDYRQTADLTRFSPFDDPYLVR